MFAVILLKPDCTKFSQMLSRGIRGSLLRKGYSIKGGLHSYFLPAQTNFCSEGGTEVWCGADAFPNMGLFSRFW